MQLDLSCFESDFNRLNLKVQKQSKHLRTKELLYESQVSSYINENKEDLLDYIILEQVRRDQWNRQYGFLLTQLGYEALPEEDIQKNLNEGFGTDLLIDIFFAGMPALIRTVGATLSIPTFGGAAITGEMLAKLFAGGGAAYYAYYAYQEYEANKKLNARK